MKAPVMTERELYWLHSFWPWVEAQTWRRWAVALLIALLIGAAGGATP